MKKLIWICGFITCFICFSLNVYADDYGILIDKGDCKGSLISWAVYDSNEDSIADIYVLDGEGVMPNYEMFWSSGELERTTIPWINYSKTIERIICKGKITHIGDCAFAYMPIQTLDLSSFCDSNLTIGRFSFYNCLNLELNRIPNNVVSIGDAAFENCSISKIVLTNNVVNFGNYCIGFDYDMNTDKFKIHNQFEICCEKSSDAYKYGVKNNLPVTIIDHDWDDGSVTVEPTCTIDGQKTYTCNNCDNTKVELIPAIGHTWDSGKITKKATYDEEGEKIYTCSVCGEKKTEILPILAPKLIKKGSKFSDPTTGSKYKVVLRGKTVSFITPKKNAKSIVIPDNVRYKGVTYKVTIIGVNACKKNKSITSVSIGSNVQTVSKNAFYGCPSLKKVTGGKRITTIGVAAFNSCTKLTSIPLGSSLTSIDANAFLKCTALKTIVIPTKVSKIGKNAFNGCKKLANITINTKKLTSKNVGANAFAGTPKTAVVKVPRSKLKSYKKWLYEKGIAEEATIK